MKLYIIAGLLAIAALLGLYATFKRLWASRQGRIAKERHDKEMIDMLFHAPEEEAKRERERLQTLDNTGLAEELNRRRE